MLKVIYFWRWLVFDKCTLDTTIGCVVTKDLFYFAVYLWKLITRSDIKDDIIKVYNRTDITKFDISIISYKR